MRTLALAVAFALLAACEQKIDGGKVEDIIENMFKEKNITAKAACPNGLDIKKGSVFQCKAKESGRELTINVTIIDEKDGMVRAVLDGMFVFTDKLAPAVKERDGFDLRCPKQTLVITPTQPGYCDIVGNDQYKKLQIDQVDPENGEVTWKPIP